MPVTATNWITMSSALKEIIRSGMVFWGVFLFGASFLVNAASGGEATAAANSQSGQIQTAQLDYSEVGYGLINCALPVVNRSTPFTKEPAFAGNKVVRGTFQPGGSDSNSIAFAWDRAAGKLYLDLNHNQDLTDDPSGVFLARTARTVYYQTFTNIHLLFNTASGKCQVLADITFYDNLPRPSCNLALRSFWQGKVTLQGQDWQVGIVQNGLNQSGSFENGRLLLRPWEKRNRSFNTYDGSLVTVPFSRKLFVDGHAYQLDLVAGPQDGEVKPALQFTEQTVPLGELKIAGKFIQRLVLSGGPYLVVLDQPAASVQVPTGSYNRPDILLEQNGAEAFFNSGQSQAGRRISVDDKTPAVLDAGGPLTNSVTASRHGRDLRLDYRLVGAGGETYQLANQNRSQPPEFAVYKGDRKIASGKFEFG
jgi:hypothetical protein